MAQHVQAATYNASIPYESQLTGLPLLVHLNADVQRLARVLGSLH